MVFESVRMIIGKMRVCLGVGACTKTIKMVGLDGGTSSLFFRSDPRLKPGENERMF
jgi:hypothetical protein